LEPVLFIAPVGHWLVELADSVFSESPAIIHNKLLDALLYVKGDSEVGEAGQTSEKILYDNGTKQ